MTTRPTRPTKMAGNASGWASHHLRICSGSVLAFSCQPPSNGRLSGPAGKTGTPAAAKSSAAAKFGSSARVAVAEGVCIFTLLVSVEVAEAARVRRDLGIEPHHGISSFISLAGSNGGGGGGAAAAGREAEGRRMRMQSVVFPPIVVLVGYNSIRCPGQSSVSGQPVASQTASKFVTFNGSDFSAFLK